jgi:hypothetical protein
MTGRGLALVVAALVTTLLVTTLAASSALAQGALPLPETTKLVTEIFGLFVVATVMESALATLFNWRLYREFFSGRAVKTLVMIGFGYAVVTAFNYDVFARIVGFAGGNGAAQPTLSQILSALVLAGGSATVYQLFRALGLRAPVEPEDVKLQPAENKAWVSVRISRSKAIGDVQIHVDEVRNPTPAEENAPALAGVVNKSGFLERLRSVFFADQMRWPRYGGRTVDANKVYRIVATGRRKSDNPDEASVVDFSEEIYAGRFAGRAVVDFRRTI